MRKKKYEPRPLDTLLAIPDQLSQFASKPQRLSFVMLLKHMAIFKMSIFPNKEFMATLLTGALIFEMQYVKKLEYHRYSPNKDQDQSMLNRFFKTGSAMYTEIKKSIISSNNKLTHDEQIIYLNKLYHFIDRYFQDEEFEKMAKQYPSLFWKNKQQLLDDIILVMKKIREKIVKQFELYINSTPLADVVKNNTEKAHAEYLDLNNNRSWFYKNNTHEKLMKFLALMEQTSVFESKERALDIQVYAALYVLWSIEGEFKYRFLLYPQGSRFLNHGSEAYKKCLHILNKINLDGLNQSKKINLLRELITHLVFIKNHHLSDVQALCQKLQFSDLDSFYQEIEQKLCDEQIQKASFGWTATILKSSVEYGIGIMASFYLMDFMLPILIGAIMSPVLQRIMVDYIYQSTLDKFGTNIVKQASTVATYTYDLAKEELKKIFNHPLLDNENKENIIEWISTLLTLPDAVISAVEKSRIRNAFGINSEDTLSEEDQLRNRLGVGPTIRNRLAFN